MVNPCLITLEKPQGPSDPRSEIHRIPALGAALSQTWVVSRHPESGVPGVRVLRAGRRRLQQVPTNPEL